MQNEPDDFQSMEGKKVIRRMSVDYISFSAHVDYTQNARFIDEVKPAHLVRLLFIRIVFASLSSLYTLQVLCHGEFNNVTRLRSALRKSYADRKQDIQIYAPANAEALKIRLTRTRIARVRSVLS